MRLSQLPILLKDWINCLINCIFTPSSTLFNSSLNPLRISLIDFIKVSFSARKSGCSDVSFWISSVTFCSSAPSFFFLRINSLNWKNVFASLRKVCSLIFVMNFSKACGVIKSSCSFSPSNREIISKLVEKCSSINLEICIRASPSIRRTFCFRFTRMSFTSSSLSGLRTSSLPNAKA